MELGDETAEEGEEEEDTPYDEVRFSRIPEQFLSYYEIETEDSRPVLKPASPAQPDGQLAEHDGQEKKDEGEGDNNTHF